MVFMTDEIYALTISKLENTVELVDDSIPKDTIDKQDVDLTFLDKLPNDVKKFRLYKQLVYSLVQGYYEDFDS